ncbi:MAG TPA: MBL fold metallo-hydrolase [Brevundimonas sp.]|jgi:glyoxylase-like metal-dependent hydrolase (beta-lactamase superfamily II)|uniref:MBL fold metallo-hydrolase n=1 Tax=Brevundimonas sp. TaxID=1871086 RepID=UPI002E15473D|nr:MBL fold metallo-hydrolase [Brevundimonas sp.]
MTLHFKLALLAGALGVVLSACSPAPEATEPDSAAAVTSPDVYAFTIGDFQAFALRDGGLSVPNDGSTLAMGEPKADVDALLTRAGLSADTLDLSIQPLLVRAGERVVLFDTGAAGQMGTEGKLPASLAAAGVNPDQVTDVLISHGHGDHVGGLVRDGALAFPNAAIRMSADEWAALQADTAMAGLVQVIRPKIETFAAGAEVLPGVQAVDIDGHTPGHSGFEIVSGADRLLYIADTMHHQVISVQRPTWTIAFDGDEAVAEASRQALLARAADQNARVYAFHFPFPGLGRIERREGDFVWTPEG